jgi:hypothetical protein
MAETCPKASEADGPEQAGTVTVATDAAGAGAAGAMAGAADAARAKATGTATEASDAAGPTQLARQRRPQVRMGRGSWSCPGVAN